VAGRSFGPWVLALSWVATLASGGSFLGYPSLVYSYGWVVAFWVSGSIVRDLIQKTFHIQLGERRQRSLTYFVTAAAGVVVLTLALSKPPFLIPLVIHYTGGSASVLFWPSLATLYWKRATSAGILSGLIGGGLVYVVVVGLKPFEGIVNFHPFMYAFPVSGILVYVGSMLTERQTESRLEFYFGRDEVDSP